MTGLRDGEGAVELAGLVIRPYRPSDVPSVRQLHEIALRHVGAYADGPRGKRWDTDLDDIPSSYLAGGGQFLVGEIDGRVVAMGALRVLDERRGEIKRMRVSPDHQRRGFGRAILAQLEDCAAMHGLQTLVLDTAPVWDAARAFYASAGYLEIARGQRDGFDLIFMEKNLATGSKHDIEPNHRVVVRAATLSDVSAVADLHLASWRTAYRGIVPEAYLRDVTLEGRQARWRRALSARESRHTDTLVAVDGVEVVGVCSFGPRQDDTASTGEIHSLHIQPQRRRTGMGTLLLNNAVRRLAERGFDSAVLWVLEANAGARQFYEVLGWLPTGEQRVEDREGHAIPEVRYRTVLPHKLVREA